MAQKLMGSAEELVAVVAKASKVHQILLKYGNIGTSKEQMTAVAQFVSAMEAAAEDQEICAAPIPRVYLRAFAHWCAMMKFHEGDAKTGMQLMCAETLTGPKLGMSAEEAKAEQEEVWSDAFRDLLMNCESRRMGAKETAGRLSQLCLPVAENAIPAGWFVDEDLGEKITHVSAMCDPGSHSVRKVERALELVEAGRASFFRPFRILDIGSELVQLAHGIAAKAATFKGCVMSLEHAMIKLRDCPSPLELLQDPASAWKSLGPQLANIDGEMRAALEMCWEDEACMKTVEEDMGKDISSCQDAFATIINGYAEGLVRSWSEDALSCGEKLLLMWGRPVPCAAEASAPEAEASSLPLAVAEAETPEPEGEEAEPGGGAKQDEEDKPLPKKRGRPPAPAASKAPPAKKAKAKAKAAAPPKEQKQASLAECMGNQVKAQAQGQSEPALGQAKPAPAPSPEELRAAAVAALDSLRDLSTAMAAIASDIEKLKCMPAECGVQALLQEVTQVQSAWVTVFGEMAKGTDITDALSAAYRRVQPGEWPGSSCLTTAVQAAMQQLSPVAAALDTFVRGKLEKESVELRAKAEELLMEQHPSFLKLYNTLKVKVGTEPFFPAMYTAPVRGSMKLVLVPMLQELAAVGSQPDFSKRMGLAVQTCTLTGRKAAAFALEAQSLLTKCQARAASLMNFLIQAPLPEPVKDAAQFDSFLEHVSDLRRATLSLSQVISAKPPDALQDGERTEWTDTQQKATHATAYVTAFCEFVVQESVTLLAPALDQLRAMFPMDWREFMLHNPSITRMRKDTFGSDEAQLDCARSVSENTAFYINLAKFCEEVGIKVNDNKEKEIKQILTEATTFVCVTSCWALMLDKDDGSFNGRQRGASVRQLKVRIRQCLPPGPRLFCRSMQCVTPSAAIC